MIARLVSVCGETGSTTPQLRLGETIGPPAESAYAVDPVAVATIIPSPLNSDIEIPLMLSAIRTTRAEAPRVSAISLSAR